MSWLADFWNENPWFRTVVAILVVGNAVPLLVAFLV